MKKMYRSILVCAVTFVAVVCLSVQANAALCMSNFDCLDKLFCNGSEVCMRGICFSGGNPCAGDEICIEAEDVCVECEDDGDCADGEICEEDLCVDPCPEISDFDDDGNCLLSKDELKAMKTFFKDKHKGEKADLKASQALDKQYMKDAKANWSE